MKKLNDLRQHLMNSIPGLAKDPDRLLTFIQDGNIEFHPGEHLSHQYRVPVKIILTDHSGDLDLVMIPLLQWLNHYQPDLVPEEAVSFQAELLTNESWDLAIEITLTERVVAKVNCEQERIDIDHRMPEFPVSPCTAQRWQLYIKSDGIDEDYRLIAEWGSEDGQWIN